jgi:hypothetical protein
VESSLGNCGSGLHCRQPATATDVMKAACNCDCNSHLQWSGSVSSSGDYVTTHLSTQRSHHWGTACLWLRSAGIISRLKNTVGWYFVREKYCSGWKNKLNKADYKPDEQGLCTTLSPAGALVQFSPWCLEHREMAMINSWTAMHDDQTKLQPVKHMHGDVWKGSSQEWSKACKHRACCFVISANWRSDRIAPG